MVMCVTKVTFGSIDQQTLPIDFVRGSTVGNNTMECIESQYDMPLVFWDKANLGPKLSMIRSLNAQNSSIKRGKYLGNLT